MVYELPIHLPIQFMLFTFCEALWNACKGVYRVAVDEGIANVRKFIKHNFLIFETDYIRCAIPHQPINGKRPV